MADDAKAKAKTTFSKWAASRPAAELPSAASKRQRELWEALTAFIHSNGGWVTSLPGVKDLRIEVPQGSALPAKLIGLGYNARAAGSGTRLTTGGTVETITEHSSKPIIRQHAGIVPVDIIEITLGG